MTYFVAFILAGLVILPLAFYAGRLLFQLNQQKQTQAKARQARIERITESINVIAMAMEQQQCNLSEGAIRLVNLLESLPVENPPKCEHDYPNLCSLFLQVNDLPTHEERAALSKTVRAQQDKIREEQESRLEVHILKEVAQLRYFSIGKRAPSV